MLLNWALNRGLRSLELSTQLRDVPARLSTLAYKNRYVHIHICLYVYFHTCRYAYMLISVCAYMYIYTHVYVHVHLETHACMYS